jgi:hypothetical protein
MHFRFRGNNIQVVKSQMDPETGKAKSVPLGSINRVTLAVSEKLSAGCSPGELKEIESWVKRYRSVAELKCKVAALTLPEQISAAIEWLDQADDEAVGEIAEDLFAATTVLRRALNERRLV